MAENVKERLVRYLQDAHAAETGIEDVLEGFIDDTDDPQIKALFQQHRMETRSQAERLEARLNALGASPSGGKGFLNMIMAKMSELMHGAHDEYDKNTQNLIKAYATEHLERGMYESMIAYATAIGDEATVALARQIQAEEEATAQKLFPLIQAYAKTALAGTEGLQGSGGAYTA
jgi:ferritin-like metal-binding protein YciE